MTTADMISERAARAIVTTIPHGINGDIFIGDYQKLITNIKAQMLGLLKDVGVLEQKA
ncbi:MAG TPA: hypothetical protein VJ201_03265 [Candidatus Babeliales bacterium]|nr:hypothetical protein [Candidatus Babeliales bacterium]